MVPIPLPGKSGSPLSLVVDESVHSGLTAMLRSGAFEVFAVAAESPGVPDGEVVRIAMERSAVLITEDRHFGEWVFAHGARLPGVLYLRYRVDEIDAIRLVLERFLIDRRDDLHGAFVVLSPKRIRIRTI